MDPEPLEPVWVVELPPVGWGVVLGVVVGGSASQESSSSSGTVVWVLWRGQRVWTTGAGPLTGTAEADARRSGMRAKMALVYMVVIGACASIEVEQVKVGVVMIQLT